MSNIGQKLRELFPSDTDTPERRYFKTMTYSVIFLMIVLLGAGLGTFFFTLEGDAQTTVPDIVGMELPMALIELQDRGLISTVQLRTTEDPAQRGYVVGQNPSGGALVRSGRRVEVVVSRGAVLDEIPDYVGRTLDEVRLDIRAMTGAGVPLLELGTVQRVFDEAEPGTVLEQDPRPGAEITGQTRLDFVVSRGEELEQVTLPDYSGLYYTEAIDDLSDLGIAFAFEVVPPPPNSDGGDIVSQSPRPGELVDVGSLVNLTMNEPADLADDEVFGVLQRSLPEFPLLVEISLDVVLPDGVRRNIVSMRHPGGLVGIPYIVPEGSSLVLTRAGETLVRQVVSGSE